MAIFNEAFLDRYQNEVINENFIKKIIEKIKNRHDHSDEVVFSSSQYSVYRKAIIEISKKYEHVGKYLYVLTYKDICQVGCDSESDNDFEYWVAAFDTDDRRDDKEIIAYEKGYGNRDFVRNLDKECEAFVKELNSANINGAKFDSDFDGHRFDLKMFVVKSLYVKESTDETIEEGFGRHGFRDVKTMRDDKDSDKDDDKFTTRPDGSKWQNSIDLPEDNGGWVDHINLDEASTKDIKKTNDDADITVNGKKIPIVRESNSDDANKDYEVFRKNWKSILNYIAKNTYEYYKEYCEDDDPVKAWKKPADVIPDIVFSKIWFGEPKPTHKFDCLTSVEVRYDLKPEILKQIHDDHVPDCHVYIKEHKFKATDDFFEIMYDG